jgi:hypothetical protein
MPRKVRGRLLRSDHLFGAGSDFRSLRFGARTRRPRVVDRPGPLSTALLVQLVRPAFRLLAFWLRRGAAREGIIRGSLSLERVVLFGVVHMNYIEIFYVFDFA